MRSLAPPFESAVSQNEAALIKDAVNLTSQNAELNKTLVRQNQNTDNKLSVSLDRNKNSVSVKFKFFFK